MFCLPASLTPFGLDGKESAWNAGDSGSILGQEEPLKKELATHSNILGLLWWLRQ